MSNGSTNLYKCRTHNNNNNRCGDEEWSLAISFHEIFGGKFFYVLATQRQTHLLERLAIYVVLCLPEIFGYDRLFPVSF